MYKGGTRQRGKSTAAPPIVTQTEARDWQLSARCRGTDPSMFFHPDGERGRRRHKREREAKRFCAQCPVRIQCLVYSLRSQEPYGIWGGVTENERRRILDARMAGSGP
jgi:WhiB family transcriptional regulator, redox-sensing transcriptional regulator